MTLLLVTHILSLVFGKDLKMMLLYYGNMVGEHSLSSFLDYLNMKMEIAGDAGLEFLDLKLKINEGKIRVDVLAKSTNSFSYTTPNTCYPKNNICNIPRCVTLRLRRVLIIMKPSKKHHRNTKTA